MEIEKHFKINSIITLKIEGELICDEEIKVIKENRFKMPDRAGIYYISDELYSYKCIVHDSSIIVYYDEEIAGYFYNNQYYNRDGKNIDNLSDAMHHRCTTCVKIPYLGFSEYHIILPTNQVLGNISSSLSIGYPGVLPVIKVLGNIKMPDDIQISIVYHPTRLISYSYDDISIKLSPDIFGSQLIQVFLKRMDTKTTYLFYQCKNKIIYLCDDNYYDLDGYYIDNVLEELKFLFSITI